MTENINQFICAFAGGVRGLLELQKVLLLPTVIKVGEDYEDLEGMLVFHIRLW